MAYSTVSISVIVALFIGLTTSSEEIIGNLKILQREKFLNLSKGSYLFSKIGIIIYPALVCSVLLYHLKCARGEWIYLTATYEDGSLRIEDFTYDDVFLYWKRYPNLSDKNAVINDNTEGFGTGFFISHDGYILTCYHVIEDANYSPY